ncbi:MAG: hypothetical protein K6G16_08675 [Lachnospiraceae bacterium]|nr:hypothetical protein [Lachnospiraceae bacterium]
MEIVTWYLCFVISLILFAAGILYLIRRKEISEETLAKASLLEFAAGVFQYVPEELFNDVPASHPVLEVVESIFTAILRTFNIYLGNDYSRVAFDGHPVFSAFYATLMTLTNLALLLFAGVLIIKFLEGPVQKLKFFFHRKKNLYLFPVCTDKTLAIAESISDPLGSPVFLFREELSSENRERIGAAGGLFLNVSPAEAVRKACRKGEKLEIFLFDEEAHNLSLLEEICEVLPSLRQIPVRIYVELSRTPWSLYDDFLEKHNVPDGEHLVINFVRTEENFVYNDLLKHSIFENAVPVKKDGKECRKIGVLIVGMNERNMEMFKAVLHLSQMPGYRLTVLVLDAAPLSWDEVLQQIPEIWQCETEGNALYEHHWFEGVDFATDKMESACDMYLPDFNFAFVNAGDDLLNLNLALRLQAYRFRRNEREGYQIQVNIRDQKICRYWSKALTERLTLVGDTAEVYSHSFITMSDIEEGSRAIHVVRYPPGEPRDPEKPDGEKNPTWIEYCNTEYNRHSVYARTLSFKYKVQLIDEFHGGNYSITATDRIWKVYEHMRWDVYTRTMGFSIADGALSEDPSLLDRDGNLKRTFRNIARVHPDLIDFEALPQKEQDKDKLKLTPEIVKILKSI